MGPYTFSYAVDQLDGQRLDFEADFNISEESNIFIHIPLSASTYFNCVFKLVLINRGRSLSERVGWILEVVVWVPGSCIVITVSLQGQHQGSIRVQLLTPIRGNLLNYRVSVIIRVISKILRRTILLMCLIALLLLNKALLINNTPECAVRCRRWDSTTSSSLDVLSLNLRMIVS